MLIAVNPHLINKASADLLAKFNGSFNNLDLSAQELALQIDQGFAFCSQHKNGRRASANFTAAGFLAVDVDHGLSLEAAMDHPYVIAYASIIYTSPSHTSDAHRFRIIFELEDPLMCSQSVCHALTGLVSKFGSDKSCIDACRMFFGSRGSNPRILCNKLPTKEVSVLAVLGQELRGRKSNAGEDGVSANTVRSRANIPVDTLIKTLSNTVSTLSELPAGTRVFCPQHIDTRASAFTVRNKNGNPGVYCSACSSTFFAENAWLEKSSAHFDYHWDSVLNVSVEEHMLHADEADFVSLSDLRGGSIRVLNDRYLPYTETTPVVIKSGANQPSVRDDVFDMPDFKTGLSSEYKITLVKSAKGSGKTEWLKNLVRDYRSHGVPVLMIGHRRALISATSHRIGLTSYLGTLNENEDGTLTQFAAPPNSYYAVCVDSLRLMEPATDKYDVIIIDEVEQVFAHLLSSTLKEHRRHALQVLQHYIKQAKAVYFLDADLNRVTVEIALAIHDNEPPSYQAIVNQWQAENRTIQLYKSHKPDELIGELAASLTRGERCFVCSNSKKLIEEIHDQLVKISPRPLRTLLVTRENSQKPEIQKIIRDIKQSALQYDAIFASPSLGTGIDITFEDDAALIDNVFGFFRANINTHFDIDQQLSRVRNPKRVNVWVSPEEFHFETDPEVIKAELRASEGNQKNLLRIESDGTKVFEEDALYQTVFATITAGQRASKNRLLHHFMQLRKSNGWAVSFAGGDAGLTKDGKDIAKQGKEARRVAEFDRVLQAPVISHDRYQQLRFAEKSDRLRDGDAAAMRRHEVETFYRQKASLELLVADDEQRLRNSIKAYENLIAEDSKLIQADLYAEQALTPDKPSHLLKKQIMVELFTKAGIFAGGAFNPEVRLTAVDLVQYIAACREQKVRLERLFSIGLRGDMRRNPITQLKTMLKIHGLSLKLDRRDQAGGNAKVIYKFDADALIEIQQRVKHRADPDVKKQWEFGREEGVEQRQVGAAGNGTGHHASDPLDWRGDISGRPRPNTMDPT